MSRILQVRRGTAAQNDIFTGLPGEITMDTDAKTIRVHDGETLGGIALARADDAPAGNGGAAFDIDSVPDEFWDALFARYGTVAGGFKVLTGYSVPVTNSSAIDYVFDTVAEVHFARVSMLCQSPEAGYAAGDIVTAFGIGDYCAPVIQIINTGTATRARLMIGEQLFWVAGKETGHRQNITNANWRLIFKLYC